MKITTNWLNVSNRRRNAENVKHREIERIGVSDEGNIVIIAKGEVQNFQGQTYTDEPQRLMILDVTNENLIDLYLEIQKALFDKINPTEK